MSDEVLKIKGCNDCPFAVFFDIWMECTNLDIKRYYNEDLDIPPEKCKWEKFIIEKI